MSRLDKRVFDLVTDWLDELKDVEFDRPELGDALEGLEAQLYQVRLVASYSIESVIKRTMRRIALREGRDLAPVELAELAIEELALADVDDDHPIWDWAAEVTDAEDEDADEDEDAQEDDDDDEDA